MKKVVTEPFIINPGAQWVIVQEVSFETKTESGLILPGQAKTNSNGHRLIAIADTCKNPNNYKPGDMLLVNPMSGIPVTIESIQYKVIYEGDIFGSYDHKRLKVTGESTVLHKEKSGMITDKDDD